MSTKAPEPSQSDRILACVEQALKPFNLRLLPQDGKAKAKDDYAWMAQLPYPDDARVCAAVLAALDRLAGCVPWTYIHYLQGVVEDAQDASTQPLSPPTE